MTRILLPEHKERPLVFYLAMEEYIAGETGIGDAFSVDCRSNCDFRT